MLGRWPINIAPMLVYWSAFSRLNPASGAGSTDMGNISHRMPSIHPMIACAPPNVVIHNEFAKWAGSEKGDKVLDGAKAMAMTAIDILGDETLRAQSDELNATARLQRKR